MSTGVSPNNFRVGKYFRPSIIRTHTFHNTKIVDGHVALPNDLKYGEIVFKNYFQTLNSKKTEYENKEKRKNRTKKL